VSFGYPILIMLDLICCSVFALLWLSAIVMVNRWYVRRTIAKLQIRLETWASEAGYTIIAQERPPMGSWPHRIFVSGFFPWLFSPSGSPWKFDLHWRSFGFCVPSLSTGVVIDDRQGNRRRGQMQYLGAPLGGFWWSIESRWKDNDEPPHSAETLPTQAWNDPLWDRAIDQPGP
jgi:hypothetical protein